MLSAQLDKWTCSRGLRQYDCADLFFSRKYVMLLHVRMQVVVVGRRLNYVHIEKVVVKPFGKGSEHDKVCIISFRRL